MKRVEYLLIALMSLCAVIFIGACAKKSSESMVQTPNSPATTYPYNQRPCSNQIIHRYERILNRCNYARTYRQQRECSSLINLFIAEYPQINCRVVYYPGYSPRYNYKSISEENIRKIESTYKVTNLR
jgi:hypothetical protein